MLEGGAAGAEGAMLPPAVEKKGTAGALGGIEEVPPGVRAPVVNCIEGGGACIEGEPNDDEGGG